MKAGPALAGDLVGRLLVGLAIAATLLPLVGVIVIALDPPPGGFGENPRTSLTGLVWRETAGAGEFGPLPRTLLLALLVCLGAGAMGTALAWLASRADYPGRRPLCALGLVPFALPSYLLAMTAQDGLGSQEFRGLLAAVAVLILATSPYAQLLIGASLQRVDPGPEEAARSLGAAPGTVFRKVLLPRLRPALAYALLLVLLYTVSDFGVVDVLDCEVLTWSLYRNVVGGDLGGAATEGLGLVALVLPLILVARLIHGRAGTEHGTGQAHPASRLRLGRRGRAAAYALHALQIGGGVMLPAFVMLSWIFPAALQDGAWDLGVEDLLLRPLLASLALAAVGTGLALALAAAPAWRAARPRQGLARGGLAEAAIHAAQALPGVLVAFGVLMCAREFARRSGGGAELYDRLGRSGLLVVFGLGLRFLGQVFGSLKTAVLRLDRRHEEAARSLGASAGRIARRIQLRALTPGIAAAALLAALGILKELPITLMLRPRDISPLSYRLYGRYNEGNLLEAGIVGLVMAVLALGLSALARRL